MTVCFLRHASRSGPRPYGIDLCVLESLWFVKYVGSRIRRESGGGAIKVGGRGRQLGRVLSVQEEQVYAPPKNRPPDPVKALGIFGVSDLERALALDWEG